MNWLRNTIPVLIIVLGMTQGSKGQSIEKFPRDSVKFLETMRDFMMESRRKKGKDFIDDRFTPVWYGGKFSQNEREKVYEMANLMLDERMRPFPQFRDFLLAIMSFVDSDRPEESFNSWIATLKKMLGGRGTRKFNKFLEISSYLFSDNILYKSRSTKWQASNGNYSFRVEDDKPVIHFPSLTLKCYAKGDSSVIYDTKGVFYPTEEEWVGEGGKVTWHRAGFDTSKTYAILRDYEIPIHSPRFDADSVEFHTPYFDRALLGKLREKILAGRSGKKALYPKFNSYDKRLSIEDFVKNVDYEGGLTFSGANFQGSGSENKPAILRFYRKGNVLAKVKSLNFTFSPDRFTSQEVSVAFYIEEDSITHPNVKFKFDKKKRLFTLIREDKGLSKTPFYNSYHELEMYFEALYWKIDDPLIRMGSLVGSTRKQAAFESSSFFSESRYERLNAMSNVHPLVEIKHYTKKIDTTIFDARSLAEYMKAPFQQINMMLINFMTKGFVHYDTEKKIVQVRQKLFDYVLNNSGKKDYDVILFNSDISGDTKSDETKNATLSLLNYDLNINGVPKIILSKTQRVTVFPKNEKVTVKKNRNFTFSGVLNAGKLIFFGDKFSFEYKPFEVNLMEVDSCRIMARQLPGEDGDTSMMIVQSVIEDVKGKVTISQPKNKSGIHDRYFTKFPVFENHKKSYVYYDDQEVQDGAYERDKFYFQMKPFKMDSLDDFDNKSIAFDGTFSSGGVLPDFEEELRLQQDHSLGFIRAAPEGGFPLYKGRANFDNKIKLSNDGLQGNGKLTFMTAFAKSEEFTFFPDSTTGLAQDFVNKGQKENPNVPQVKGDDVKVRYFPKENIMTADKVENPLSMYNGDVALHGRVELGKNGMGGNGKMVFEDAELSSKNFSFKNKITDADTASFNLTSPGAEDIAFTTDNVNAHVDFEKRKGEFKSNGEDSFVEFPENQYICYMDKFNWFMDQNNMELEASKELQNVTINSDLDLSGSNFYSVHPDQDSLNFMAPKAEYNIKEKVITAKEIPYIPVADARVAPDSGKIKIFENARIDPLMNAEILANSITKYHHMKNARVEIDSKTHYEGYADYMYEDVNKMKQSIHFKKVTVDTTNQTYAVGNIPQKKDFTLSPHFKYKGDVRLTASKKNLTFNGKVQITHDCQDLARNWLSFKTEVDPMDVMIPVSDSTMNIGDTAISNGVVLAPDDGVLYSTFLSKKRDTSDINVLSSTGYLRFYKPDQEYQIANTKKLKQKTLPGNFVSLNTKSCQVSGQGEIDLGCDLGHIKLRPIGSMDHSVEKDQYSINSSVLADFFMKEKALELMAEKMMEHPNLDAFDFGKKNYEYAMREIIGMEETDQIISDLTLKGEIKRLPDELEKTFFLTELDMVWNEETSSYRSTGKIGIGTVLDEQVFKYVDGHVEVKKKRSGDEIKIYFELDEKNWFYFEYKRGIMQTVSSYDEYNEHIKNTKTSNRKYDNEKDEASFRYMLGSERKKIRFVSEFEE